MAHSDRVFNDGIGSLPVTEAVNARVYSIPWFKHNDTAVIDEYVRAFRKVIGNYKLLLADDPGNPPTIGGWHLTARKPANGAR